MQEQPRPISSTLEQDSKALSAWVAVAEILKQNLSPLKFNTWIKPICPMSFVDEQLTVSIPSLEFYEVINGRFGSLIDKALFSVAGENARLSYRVSSRSVNNDVGVDNENYFQSISKQVSEDKVRSSSSSGEYNIGRFNLDPNYSFDTFVKSNNNDLAAAAALSVASKPSSHYNPLMVYGGVGLGKTHLIQAVANKLVADNINIKVLYISGYDFLANYVDTVKNNTTHEFEKFYKSRDVLIVDDIQILEGKSGTQDTFFQIFNSLYQLKKQIVLSSDKLPHLLRGVEERLITRFQWGLTVDIQPPDLETRIAILLKKCEAEEINLSYPVLEFIALNIKDDIRSLEGCLKNVIFDSAISNLPITVDLARRSVIKYGTLHSKRQNVDIGLIITRTASYFNVDESLIRMKTKRQEVVVARHAAMFLSKELTPLSLQTIGSHFGGRGHATVIHACRCIENLISSDSFFLSKINKLKQYLLTA